MADVPALQELIEISVRNLSVGFYTPPQIDAAMRHVFGVDTQLIADGTYYVIPGPSGPVATGGWSTRRTLYGGDQMKAADDPLLDPAVDAARIRAFFVHPNWARRGLARQIYAACEQAAYAAGFRQFELMATLPGEPLYRTLGFTAVERVVTTLADGVDVPFVRMTRRVDDTSSFRAAEAALRRAQLAGDVAALDGLLDEALVFTGPDGAVYGKRDDIEAHRSGGIRITQLEPSDERVQDFGDIVVVSVRMEMRGSFNGTAFAGPYRYTRIWRRQSHGWRVVAGHVSACAPDPA